MTNDPMHNLRFSFPCSHDVAYAKGEIYQNVKFYNGLKLMSRLKHYLSIAQMVRAKCKSTMPCKYTANR